MDGWEAARQLKADERTRHIPSVALTGHALAGHAEGARQAGCDSFVTKPCLPDALVAEIQRMLAAKPDAGPGKKGEGPPTPARERSTPAASGRGRLDRVRMPVTAAKAATIPAAAEDGNKGKYVY